MARTEERQSLIKTILSRYLFGFLLIIFQCVFIVLYAVHAEYGLKVVVEGVNGTATRSVVASSLDGDVEFFYPFFQDVHVMMFIGFGFLMTFLKRYSFSSVAFNFIVAAFTLEWAILVRGYAFFWNNETDSFRVDVKNLLQADFVCAAILISLGAVLGKTSPAQLIVMALIEVVIQVWNQYVGLTFFCVYDAGESIFVHTFGAYFGLAVSFILSLGKKVESSNEGANYVSDLFSMIGTLFLFCFWPSFNAGTAVGDGRLRAVTNTYISICASVILTFAISAFVGRGKKEAAHVQNATLAGGVAVGAIADKNIGLFGAMIIGSVAGLVSTLGFKFLTNLLKKIRIHDTCGVNNLHGMPGIISGLGAIVVAALPFRSLFTENLTDRCLGGGLDRSAGTQAGYQAAGLILTIAMAVVGGLLTGLILRLPIFVKPKNDSYFDDSLHWQVPEDFHSGTKGKTRTRMNPNTIEVRNDIPPQHRIRPSFNQYRKKAPGLSSQTKIRPGTRSIPNNVSRNPSNRNIVEA